MYLHMVSKEEILTIRSRLQRNPAWKRKSRKEASRGYRAHLKSQKQVNVEGDDLLENLLRRVVTGIRGKREYAHELDENVARIGAAPSARGALSPLSAVITTIKGFSCAQFGGRPTYCARVIFLGYRQ